MKQGGLARPRQTGEKGLGHSELRDRQQLEDCIYLIQIHIYNHIFNIQIYF